MQKILIIEDDIDIQDILKNHLIDAGYEVAVASDGVAGIAIFDDTIDLVLLDIMLPKIDGYGVCEVIRKRSQVPIIMLTALSDEENQLRGFEQQIDDYIPKPFNPRELLARIRAVLRRQANELPGAPSQEEAVIAFGKFKLNLGTREMFREDEPMPLTSGEFAVLKALVSHPREPLSRDKLMNLARGREYSAMERSIDVQISRLRRMVEEDPAHPRYIQTVWGLGYVFVPDGSKA